MNSNSQKQNTVTILVIVLLVLQTTLLIFVLGDLKFIRNTIEMGGNSPSDPIISQVGEQAPDFNLTDVNEKPITLSENKGRLVLLVFTSHTCPYCREMYPHLRQFIEENPDTLVMVLAMNTTEENQEFQNEFDFKGYPNLHILAATREVTEDYLIFGTPTFVVVDVDGKIANGGYATTAEQILELIRKE